MDGAGRTYGESRAVYRVLVGKPEEKRLLPEDPGVDGWIILRWIFKK
jgi:glutathione S-transferase